MQFRRGIHSYQQKNLVQTEWFKGFLFLLFISGLIIQGVTAADGKTDNLESGPDVAIIDASVKMDTSDLGEIPLGALPEESLIVTITVQNAGNREAPGYKIRSYLVRVGREDEVGAQLGGDVTDTRLAAGETRTYTKSSIVPSHLKKGQYRVMVVLDTSNYFIEPETDNNRLYSEDTIVPGAFSGPEGSIPVYSPVTISEPGYYLLKRDINEGKKVNIFEIKSSGVTFDGGGNTISGISSGFTTGIYVDAGSAIKDVIIKNVVIKGVDAGVWFYKVSNGKIEGCTVENTAKMGLRLDQSHQNEITGNTLKNNAMGLGVFESKDNRIYNNLFQNEHNAVANENPKNSWNTALKGGTNIIGGSMIGGNAWFDASGKAGFSTNAQDYTHNGISDAPYSINQNNIDLYPLTAAHDNKSSLRTTEPTVISVETITESDENETVTSWKEETPNLTKTEPSPVITIVPTPTTIEKPEVTEIEENQVAEVSTLPTLSPYADIGVLKIDGPLSGCPGSEINLSSIIANAGGYDADSFQVRYYLTQDRQIGSEDIILGEKTMHNLLSGTEQTITETFVLPELIGLNNYYFAIITNTDNSVFEDKKGNNTGYSSERMAIREC